MKKFLNVLMLVFCFFVGLLFSCQNPTNSENTDYTDFSEGWWVYTDKKVFEDNEETGSHSYSYYFYYEQDKSISKSYCISSSSKSGWENTLTEKEKSYYEWDDLILKNGVEVFNSVPADFNGKKYNGFTAYYTFEKIAEEDLPSWISASLNTFSAGWYLYTTNANSAKPQKTYFHINSDGTIARAGSESDEYSGTQLERLQSQFSYSVCVKNADGTVITFSAAQAPSWAENSSSGNNSTGKSSGDDNPASSNESSSNTNLSLEEGYEWWCFEKSYLGDLNGFVLYDSYGKAARAGTSKEELSSSLYLQLTKESALANFTGTKYKITDLTQLPSWCYN